MIPGVFLTEEGLQALAVQVAETVVKRLAELFAKPQVEQAVSREKMAELLGVGVATVDRLVRDNIIPSMMPGTRRLFLPSKVYEALNTRR